MSFSILRAHGFCAGLSAAVLAVSCIASSQAQKTATYYGFCSAVSPTSGSFYVSNVFGVPANAQGGANAAFVQYIQSRDNTVKSANCGLAATQQQANTQKQNVETRVKQMSQTPKAAGAKTLQLVETGWSYQAPAAAAATAGATPAAGVSSVGSSATAAGQSVTQGVQQNVNSSVQNMESSTANAATTSINSTITNGMSALQGKLFHKGSGQTPANGSGQPAANGTGTATATAGSSGTPGAPANLAASSTPHDPTKPTIQEEGDGKHSIMMTPGSKDAIELTPVEGSKNVYIDEATGDKYVVLPSGDITHIAKKAPATAQSASK